LLFHPFFEFSLTDPLCPGISLKHKYLKQKFGKVDFSFFLAHIHPDRLSISSYPHIFISTHVIQFCGLSELSAERLISLHALARSVKKIFSKKFLFIHSELDFLA
jgi:hypothetical protein